MADLERFKFCPQCGAAAVAGTLFCGECGASLEKAPISKPASEPIKPSHDVVSPTDNDDARTSTAARSTDTHLAAPNTPYQTHPDRDSLDFGPRRRRWVLPVVLVALILMGGGAIAAVLVTHHASPSANSPAATHTHSYIDGYNFAAQSVVPLEQSVNRYYSPALAVQFCDQKAGDGETKPANDYADEWIQGCEDGLAAKSTTPLTPSGALAPVVTTTPPAPTSPPITFPPTTVTEFVVPNIVGEDINPAQASLEAAGFGNGYGPPTLSFQCEFSSSVELGYVISTDPPAGTRTASVVVTMSGGSEASAYPPGVCQY